MNFLKGLGISILSFILFLTLSVFSIAYMLHGTVLSSDFVMSQVDKIQIGEIATDVADGIILSEIPQDTDFYKGLAVYIVVQQEPWLKKEIKAAVNTGYDYLMGRSDTFYITIPLSELKSNLKGSLWQDTKDYLKKQLAGKSDAAISDYLQDIIRFIPRGLMPSNLAALPDEMRNLAIEQYLRDFTDQKPITNLPPEINTLVQSYSKEYFDRYLDDFTKAIPDDYIMDESKVGPETMDTIHKIRTGIDYFQTYYIWLIVLMIVLAALIFLISMNIRVTARSLGVSLTIFGVIDLVGVILMKSLPIMDWTMSILQQDIPASLNTWASGLISDISSVALPLSIGILAAGVVLLVVSFIIPKKEVAA